MDNWSEMSEDGSGPWFIPPRRYHHFKPDWAWLLQALLSHPTHLSSPVTTIYHIPTSQSTLSSPHTPFHTIALDVSSPHKPLRNVFANNSEAGSKKALVLTEAERIQRREESARRRKRQMEQRLQDEQVCSPSFRFCFSLNWCPSFILSFLFLISMIPRRRWGWDNIRLDGKWE